MVKISGVIISFNEESNIARCIDSMLPVVDEIVVVDSLSTDRTREICLERGVRFLEHPFRTHIDQKNYAVSQATYPYILSLDADEYLSAPLTQSILKAKANWTTEAYRMNRLSSYGNKWIKHGSWYPDKKIRLWNRNFGFWGGENPHDRVIIKRGIRIEHLKGDILHRAYKDAKESLQKIQRYSDIFAIEGLSEKSSSVPIIFFHTFFAFVKSYLIKRGFQDGYEGLMVAMGEANHVFYKYAKLLEANSKHALGNRVIISRTDNLGDVILTLPLVGYLKAVRPSLKIFFIGKQYTQPIVNSCAHVDKFLDHDQILKDPSILAEVNADTIFFVYPDRELARIAEQVSIRNRIGTGHRWYNWLYCTHRIGFSRIRSLEHESQLNFKLLAPFKIYWDFDVKEMASLYGLSSVVRSHNGDLSPDRINIIFHPKSKGSAREWTLDNYLALAKMFSPDEYNILITGLKHEGESIRQQKPELFDLPHVKDMTGKLDLYELMSMICLADGLIACSTGVLHLAAALGKPCVGLYSPMKPIHPGRWMPIGKKASFLVVNKECSDCRNSKSCHCVNEIAPSLVKATMEKAIPVATTGKYAHY